MSKILVWLSWGVDSAVSAWLLREQGHEVSCGYMINYLDEENPNCPTRVDLEEARRVADFLGLPFYTFDYREEYERRIVDYIYREYSLGRTPNPDVFCNNLVKFDLFLEEALLLGFDAIAMGHYARVWCPSPKIGEAGRGVFYYPSHPTYIQKYAWVLRQNLSYPEHLAWENIFRKKQLLGYKFLKQHTIDSYIVDFFCHALRLIIEIDGAFHTEQQAEDTMRDNALMEYGYRIIRIPAYEILWNISGVYEFLREWIENNPAHPLDPPILGGDWNSQKYSLLKWIDPNKDQSYFLSRLSPFQLSKAIFPIGHLQKSEVREIAKKAWLPNANRKDSQWLCFIGKVSMKEFLEKRFPKKPGNILDISGKVIGTHEWAFSYTIGQRKGIEIWGGPALFVVAKDTVANTITVGGEADLHLFSSSCTLTDWVGDDLQEWKKYGAKVRYRQEDQDCQLKVESWKLKVAFQKPQRAIASGQICVIYDGEKVVGSGVIS
jgi:tRNA U34 2-thiouridine synthase MnmA/TrmU